jgi:hypothetical protein
LLVLLSLSASFFGLADCFAEALTVADAFCLSPSVVLSVPQDTSQLIGSAV